MGEGYIAADGPDSGYLQTTEVMRDGLGNLDNMGQFLSDKLPWVMPLPGS